jgi:hypothetical protein
MQRLADTMFYPSRSYRQPRARPTLVLASRLISSYGIPGHYAANLRRVLAFIMRISGFLIWTAAETFGGSLGGLPSSSDFLHSPTWNDLLDLDQKPLLSASFHVG